MINSLCDMQNYAFLFTMENLLRNILAKERIFFLFLQSLHPTMNKKASRHLEYSGKMTIFVEQLK